VLENMAMRRVPRGVNSSGFFTEILDLCPLSSGQLSLESPANLYIPLLSGSSKSLRAPLGARCSPDSASLLSFAWCFGRLGIIIRALN
jgi:hypothetical protein